MTTKNNEKNAGADSGPVVCVTDDRPSQALRTTDSLQCPNCRKVFKSKGGLTQHIKKCAPCYQKRDNEQQPVKTRMECSICGLFFSGERGLAIHKRKKHPAEWNETKRVEHSLSQKKMRWTSGDRELLHKGTLEWEASKKTHSKEEWVRDHKFPGRTINSIRCQIRSKAFARFVAEREEATAPTLEAAIQEEECVGYILSLKDDAVRWLEKEPDGEEYLAIYERLQDGRLGEAGEMSRRKFDSLTSKFTPFAESQKPTKGRSKPVDQTSKTNGKLSPSKLRRKRRYGQCQREWHNNNQRSGLIRSILQGKFGKKEALKTPQETRETIDFWEGLFSRESTPDNRGVENAREVIGTLDNMITVEEVAKALKGKSDRARGPDGVPHKWLRELGATKLAVLYNGVFCTSKIPDSWREARTVLIPKKDEPKGPADYRPITIGSYFYRAYTTVLGGRISESIQPSQRQKGFVRTDGIRDNLCLLDGLMYHSRNRIQPLHLSFMDVRKAFDSVSHDSIRRMLKWSGIPPLLRSVVNDLYIGATTSVLGKKVPINVGVKQGDPLSSVLFNLVIDMALDGIGDKLGVSYLGEKISWMAFADDLVILASSRATLQELITTITDRLERVGLAMNGDKCKSLSLMADGKRKRTYVDTSQKLYIGKEMVDSMSITDYYTYLGIGNGARGVKRENLHHEWKTLLDRTNKAPLKPHQKLHVIRKHAYPTLQHKCSFQETSKKCLTELDKLTRRYVREWMWLPSDTATEAFYASVEDGGLQLPSFRYGVPLNKYKRLCKMRISDDPLVQKLASAEPAKTKIRNAKDLCKVGGRPVEDKSQLKSEVRDAFWRTKDGKGLRTEPMQVKRGNFVQMQGGVTTLSTRNFVGAWNVRLNTTQTPARKNRAGGAGNSASTCDKCPNRRAATLGHISQSCPETHGSRTKRHDRVVDHLQSALLQAREVTDLLKEPVIRPKGKSCCKPDLVIAMTDKVVIVDVQVTSDGGIDDLEGVGKRKTDKYGTPEIMKATLQHLGLPADTPISVHAFSITWRGNTLRHTLETASILGVTHILPRVTTDVLVDTYRMFLGWKNSGRRYVLDI